MASGSVTPPDLTEVNLDKPEPVGRRFSLGPGLNVDVKSLAWNTVRIQSPALPAPWPELESWARKWIDYEETRPKDRDGLSGIIHRVTPSPDGHSVTVDFGSAPVEAVLELLELVRHTGVHELKIDAGEMIGTVGVR